MLIMGMRRYLLTAATSVFALLGVSSGVQADSTTARCDIYPRGEDQASVTLPCTFSQRQGHINITRSDGVSYDLIPTNDAPGNYKDQAGERAYRQSGLGEDGLIFRLAEESVYVYWDATWGNGNGFEQILEQQGISFTISTANNSSINQLSIKSAGLEIDNKAIDIDIDGTVTGAEIADIDSDGWPEIYIYISSAGSGSYGSLVAYAVNKGKSISGIYLPPLGDDKINSAGYMGHDEFAVVENLLARRFPVYLKGDTNAKPTGGTRQLKYKLTQGEASWVLELDRVAEF